MRTRVNVGALSLVQEIRVSNENAHVRTYSYIRYENDIIANYYKVYAFDRLRKCMT